MEDSSKRPSQLASDYESGINDDDRIDLRIWLRLLTCTHLIERQVQHKLRVEFDTTLPRFDVLAQIDRSPEGQPMRELSQRLMVTNGNITPPIDRLIKDGLVVHEQSSNDRRVQHVKLTTAGKKALDHMIPQHKNWVSAVMRNMERSQEVALYELLGLL